MTDEQVIPYVDDLLVAKAAILLVLCVITFSFNPSWEGAVGSLFAFWLGMLTQKKREQ